LAQSWSLPGTTVGRNTTQIEGFRSAKVLEQRVAEIFVWAMNEISIAALVPIMDRTM
jgi:hypothetical protein